MQGQTQTENEESRLAENGKELSAGRENGKHAPGHEEGYHPLVCCDSRIVCVWCKRMRKISSRRDNVVFLWVRILVFFCFFLSGRSYSKRQQKDMYSGLCLPTEHQHRNIY